MSSSLWLSASDDITIEACREKLFVLFVEAWGLEDGLEVGFADEFEAVADALTGRGGLKGGGRLLEGPAPLVRAGGIATVALVSRNNCFGIDF